MTEVVIVSAVRTGIGRFNGTLKNIRAPELGKVVIEGAIEVVICAIHRIS